ncbi:MAG: hypothetical protein WD751_07600 [Anaerolineales bacterium]
MSEQQKKFIVFEYADGGNASYFIDKIRDEEILKDTQFVVEREPTYGIFGGALMPILRGDLRYEPHFLELMFGFLADRANHTLRKSEFSINGLRKNKHVICDRYNLATFAYQIARIDPSRDLPIYSGETKDDLFKWFEEVCKYFPKPDLTVFLKFNTSTLADNIKKANPTIPPFTILPKKNEEETEDQYEERIKGHIDEITNNYLMAIEYLTKRAVGRQKIEVIDVEFHEKAWRDMRPKILECLKTK